MANVPSCLNIQIHVSFTLYVVFLVTKWIQLFCKAPLSMGLPKQENWNELLFPPLGSLLNPGIEAVFLH